MKLTTREMKLAEQLRKLERLWPRLRWFLLITSAVCFAVCGIFSFLLADAVQSNDIPRAELALVVAVFWPKIILILLLAAGMFGLAVGNWHGNAQRILLLKLLDDRLKETEKETNVP